MKKLFILILAFISLSHYGNELDPRIQKAHQWLKNQMVPNAIVPPYKAMRKDLVLSYELKKTDSGYQYLFSKSNIYDNALALIAFTLLGDERSARRIIDGVKKVAPKGNFYFNYNTHNLWPSPGDSEGAIIRSGANAWFGYALALYLFQVRKEERRGADLSYLRKIVDHLLKRQVLNPQDPRYGLFLGGEGTYRFDLVKGKPVEKFNPGSIKWASLEHNIDLYFLLELARRVIDSEKYLQKMEFLKKGILNSWNPTLNQLDRGRNEKGADPVEALDAASWAAVLLKNMGEHQKARLALEKTKAYQSNGGHKPYLNLLVYEEPKANKIFYPKAPQKNWNDININWLEGSFGVALAFIKLGKLKEGKELIQSLAIFQKSNGSFPYADTEIPFQFSTSPSVASTAWFIISALSLKDQKVRDLFWKFD